MMRREFVHEWYLRQSTLRDMSLDWIHQNPDEFAFNLFLGIMLAILWLSFDEVKGLGNG